MPSKLTKEEVIQQFKEIHEDKYDYSLVKYINTTTKVKIICPVHGPFYITPSSHKLRCGCKKCGYEKNKMLSFKNLQILVRKNNIKNPKDYLEFYRKNRDLGIPRNPKSYYELNKQYNGERNSFWCDLLNIDRYSYQLKRNLPFQKALKKIRKENIRNGWVGYNIWFKKHNPIDLPINPNVVYKNKGWQDIYHWLGEDKISNHNRKWKSFIDSREIVRQQGFKSGHELKIWNRTKKPDDIPINPYRLYKKEFISMADWIGYDKSKQHLPFKEAKEYVQKLNLKSGKEYENWWKTNKPDNIPAYPDNTYKKSGWVSWGDFLGTGIVSGRLKKFLPFKEAKEYVQKLNLKSGKEYENWWKTNKPDNIPAYPDNTYKKSGWVSWGDFLGTGIVSGRLKKFLPFKEAKEYVQKLNLKSISKWQEYWKNNNLPNNIPKTPGVAYKNKGWISWGNFLGGGILSNLEKSKQHLPFEEAKEFVHKFNLKSCEEFENWWKINKPNNIPSIPERTYKNEFTCYADFLGYLGNGQHQWNKSAIIDFLKSLQSELINLSSVELITIINSNNLAKKLKELGSLEDFVSSKSGSQHRKDILNDIINKVKKTDETEFDSEEEEKEIEKELQFTEQVLEKDKLDITENEKEEELIPNDEDAIKKLKMLDNKMITASLDDENIDFLLKNKLKEFWNNILNEKEVNIDKLKNEHGGKNFEIIKKEFLTEYYEMKNLKIPKDYIFKYKPNDMQLLVSYRLLKEKIYGNWSGVGSGKTLSAILAGRIAKLKNTLIICNNSIVDGWVKSINEYFTNNNIYVKKYLDNVPANSYNILNDKYNITLPKDNENNYLILNYETFQQEDGEYIASQLFENNIFDYIILDEIQNVKQRDEDKESIRRNVINKLIIKARELNKNLYLLGMSATPVINNLEEPKKLIELLSGQSHDDLDTKGSIINGIEMYKALTITGLRYKPKYDISVNIEKIDIDGSHLVEDIKNVPKGGVLDLEKCLLKPKLDAIKQYIKPGTLIYTYYVTGIIDDIGKYVKDLGFSVGFYTGDDKAGLERFKRREVDVLIGSAPVGTGVDGIQKVCDTLIPLCVPWTSSEFDQLIGRIKRQGSLFDKVNVYIPQVIINTDNGQWSWDKKRFNIVKYKATLADLAIDGRVPKSLLPPKGKMIEDAKQELKDWLDRINKNNIITFEREELKIPLNPEFVEKLKRKLGDFSEMNRRWSVSHSSTTKDRIEKEPEEWYLYHTLYSEQRKTWSEIPYIEISKKIKNRLDWVVGDFGCGENLLSNELPDNKIYGFDYVAINNKVISCDMCNVPLKDNTLDVAVFSLSLMGSNYEDYLKEAYRTLKPFGNIFICEPSSKWKGKEHELKQILEKIGFKCFDSVKNTDRFIYIDGIKY